MVADIFEEFEPPSKKLLALLPKEKEKQLRNTKSKHRQIRI